MASHWQLFYDLLWEAGIRTGEALSAMKPDLTDGGIWITREKRRGHLRDFIPLSPTIYDRLIAHSYYSHTQGRLFPSTWAGSLHIKRSCEEGRHLHGRRAIANTL